MQVGHLVVERGHIHLGIVLTIHVESRDLVLTVQIDRRDLALSLHMD